MLRVLIVLIAPCFCAAAGEPGKQNLVRRAKAKLQSAVDKHEGWGRPDMERQSLWDVGGDVVLVRVRL